MYPSDNKYLGYDKIKYTSINYSKNLQKDKNFTDIKSFLERLSGIREERYFRKKALVGAKNDQDGLEREKKDYQLSVKNIKSIQSNKKTRIYIGRIKKAKYSPLESFQKRKKNIENELRRISDIVLVLNREIISLMKKTFCDSFKYKEIMQPLIEKYECFSFLNTSRVEQTKDIDLELTDTEIEYIFLKFKEDKLIV